MLISFPFSQRTFMLSVNYDQAKESSTIFWAGAKCEDWMAQLKRERKREDKRWEEPLEEVNSLLQAKRHKFEARKKKLEKKLILNWRIT